MIKDISQWTTFISNFFVINFVKYFKFFILNIVEF